MWYKYAAKISLWNFAAVRIHYWKQTKPNQIKDYKSKQWKRKLNKSREIKLRGFKINTKRKS